MLEDRYYTAEEVSKRFEIALDTLNRWRYERKGPKHFRFGKRIFYHHADIEAYVKEQREKMDGNYWRPTKKQEEHQ